MEIEIEYLLTHNPDVPGTLFFLGPTSRPGTLY